MSWKRTLTRMLSDSKPTSYTYDDAAAILRALGFVVAPYGGTSHRRWRALSPIGNSVIVGLVGKGSGTLKPYLVRELVNQLRANGMIPSEFEKG